MIDCLHGPWGHRLLRPRRHPCRGPDPAASGVVLAPSGARRVAVPSGSGNLVRGLQAGAGQGHRRGPGQGRRTDRRAVGRRDRPAHGRVRGGVAPVAAPPRRHGGVERAPAGRRHGGGALRGHRSARPIPGPHDRRRGLRGYSPGGGRRRATPVASRDGLCTVPRRRGSPDGTWKSGESTRPGVPRMPTTRPTSTCCVWWVGRWWSTLVRDC